MARRMIDTSMWENEKFGVMPLGAQLLLIGMINHADDQGRIKAHPVYLSKTIFPYREDVTTADIGAWLQLIAQNETVELYTVDGKRYAQLLNWWDYQSLQYAQPSAYPRPDDWCDRIRCTVGKGVILTCNWHRVSGEKTPDTCDQNGNPLLSQASHNGVHGDSHGGNNGSKPQADGQNPPGQPPGYPPGQPGERTIKDQFNINKEEHIGGEGSTGSDHAQAGEPPPPPSNPSPAVVEGKTTVSVGSNRTVRLSSPYLVDARKFRNGYIPTGTGANAVEVYYERFSINSDRERLSAPLEDDLVRECPELARLREVITAYGRRKNYAPGNVQLILDWYRKGIPDGNGSARAPAAGANGPPATGARGHTGAVAAGSVQGSGGAFKLAEVKLTAQLVNKQIDQPEYERRYAQLRADYGLPHLSRAGSLPAGG